MNRLDPDDVFRALDGPRRAGWAKFYAEAEANEELRRTVERYERTLIMTLGYWMAECGAHQIYWDIMAHHDLRDMALEYWRRQARWDGLDPESGERSPVPMIAKDLLAADELIEHQAAIVMERLLQGEDPGDP